jgi:hypothetical protein
MNSSHFGSALNPNLHFHVLQLDGVYPYEDKDDILIFISAPEIKDEDVKNIVKTTAHRGIGRALVVLIAVLQGHLQCL